MRNLVYRQMRDGSTRVSAKSNNRRTFNREQKVYQDRFGLAVAYARECNKRTWPVTCPAKPNWTGQVTGHLPLNGKDQRGILPA